MEIMDERRLKHLLKEALTEALDERKEEFREIVLEAVEDIALSRAIEEGERTPLVSRDEVFKILRERDES